MIRLPEPPFAFFLNKSACSFAAATTLAGLVLAGGLSAGEYPERMESMGGGGDWIEITREGVSHARVVYYNSPQSKASANIIQAADYPAPGGQEIMRVSFKIEISGRAADECAHLKVTAPFVVIPEMDCAKDGDHVSFIVTLPVM